MQIKLIVAGAAIALIAGVGSVSADENDVAGTAVTRGGTFALLDGIATKTMSIHELAATRGAGSPVTAIDTVMRRSADQQVIDKFGMSLKSETIWRP